MDEAFTQIDFGPIKPFLEMMMLQIYLIVIMDKFG